MLRQRRVKTFEVEDTKNMELAEQATVLETKCQAVWKLISLGQFVLAVRGKYVRVFDRETTGAVRAVFTQHDNVINSLERLENDLVVSADWHGVIFTWRPFTMETIGCWKDSRGWPIGLVAKLDDKQMVVCIGKDELVVLSHSCGSNLKIEKRIKTKHQDCIKRIVVSNNLVVSCSIDATAKVFDKSTFTYLATLRAKVGVNDVAVSETHIVLVCRDGCIYLYHNAPPYALDFVLQTPCASLTSIICLDSDMIAVSDSSGRVNFISLSKKSFLARVKLSESYVNQLAVLNDIRMAVVDSRRGHILFRPPQLVEHAVIEYTTTVYGKDAALCMGFHPILDAWNSVQQKSLSLVDACKTVKSENTTRSLEEWCVGHNLLMQAVNTGAVPKSRDYNGTKLHWHLELYQHCDELAIGEKDVTILISLFLEAEDAGVIGEGTSELFISTLRIRKDIDKDKRYTANAIYQLFLRQAKTDETLKQVLHYQNVQQITSMVNAILGFVPIGGSIATNVISGGATILNDFQICGLIESLMDVGKDMSGGFKSNKLVNMFVRRGNKVLSEEHWNNWGEGHRKAVEEAARNMGLTVDKLRDKLLRAAEMMNDGLTSNQEEIATEVVVVEQEEDDFMEYETSTIQAADFLSLVVPNAEIVRLEDAQSNGGRVITEDGSGAEFTEIGEKETGATKIENAPVLAESNIGRSQPDAKVEEAQVQLGIWANKSFNKSSMEKLKCREAAKCVAAYLVNYDEDHVGNYIRLQDALKHVFLTRFIDGSSFVHAEGTQRENLIQAAMSAIDVVAKGDAGEFMGIRLKLFLEQVGR